MTLSEKRAKLIADIASVENFVQHQGEVNIWRRLVTAIDIALTMTDTEFEHIQRVSRYDADLRVVRSIKREYGLSWAEINFLSWFDKA